MWLSAFAKRASEFVFGLILIVGSPVAGYFVLSWLSGLWADEPVDGPAGVAIVSGVPIPLSIDVLAALIALGFVLFVAGIGIYIGVHLLLLGVRGRGLDLG